MGNQAYSVMHLINFLFCLWTFSQEGDNKVTMTRGSEAHALQRSSLDSDGEGDEEDQKEVLFYLPNGENSDPADTGVR